MKRAAVGDRQGFGSRQCDHNNGMAAKKDHESLAIE